MRASRRAGSRGFTLLEMLIVVAVVGVVSMMAIPTLQHMIWRARIEGFTRDLSLLFQQCRYESIKRGVDCIVNLDSDAGRIFGFTDFDDNQDYNPDPAATDFRSTDYVVGRVDFPPGVSFQAPGTQSVVDGFSNVATVWNAPLFRSDGSVQDLGAVRVGDQRGNFLEVRVEPAATARVQLRKWDGTDWLAQGAGGKTWEWN